MADMPGPGDLLLFAGTAVCLPACLVVAWTRGGPFTKSDEPRAPVPLLAAVAVGWFYVAGVLAAGLLAEPLTRAFPGSDATSVGLAAQLVRQALLAACVLGVLRACGPLGGFGVTARDPLRQAADGSLGFATAFPPVVASLLVLIPFRGEEGQHPFLTLLAGEHSAWLPVLIAASVVLFAPLAEELLFRVVLQGLLRSLATPAVAVAGQAAAFAAVHGVQDWGPLFLFALVLGFVRERTHRLWPVVLAHAAFNGVNLGVFILNLGAA